MISFHTSLPECPTLVVIPELETSSKKRKWEDPLPPIATSYHHQEHLFFKDQSSDIRDDSRIQPATLDIELNLDTPLPSEWQQCLDIQSGQIHFFNTRTYVRTSRDPRMTASTASPDVPATSLDIDLELNLTCESLRKNPYTAASADHHHNGNMKERDFINRQSGLEQQDHHDQVAMSNKNAHKKSIGLTSRCPSWLSFESEQHEMVATVCTRCHMLVMLCKSSPACPNCKFLQPLDHNSHTLTNPKRCSLLC